MASLDADMRSMLDHPANVPRAWVERWFTVDQDTRVLTGRRPSLVDYPVHPVRGVFPADGSHLLGQQRWLATIWAHLVRGNPEEMLTRVDNLWVYAIGPFEVQEYPELRAVETAQIWHRPLAGKVEVTKVVSRRTGTL